MSRRGRVNAVNSIHQQKTHQDQDAARQADYNYPAYTVKFGADNVHDQRCRRDDMMETAAAGFAESSFPHFLGEHNAFTMMPCLEKSYGVFTP